MQATALNMINMIGIGPFITVPLLMTALGGPQALLGWILALAIVICDGLVWSELGASMPVSGGSFGYLREAFGPQKFGRLMGFLFVWQFILSGPFEIASGYIGFAQYAGYIWPGSTPGRLLAIAAAVGIVNVVLLYRRITSIGAITVTLWIGTILTSLAVVVTGGLHFDPRIAFDFPPGAFKFSLGFLFGLGTAARIGVYDYLGYYDVCYIGDEVKDPGRVIPRSIIFSTIAVGLLYIAINLSIIGVVPWREFVPAGINPNSDFVVSIFMERIYGSKIASVVTLMILWTAFGSVFALLLGYSRIPVRGARRLLLQGVRPAAPDEGVSARRAARARRPVDRLLPVFARPGHRRADRDAHPRAVHRPDRRRRAPSPPAAGHAPAVQDLVVSAARSVIAFAGWSRLRHDRRLGGRRRPGVPAARRAGVSRLVTPPAAMAVRGPASDGRKPSGTLVLRVGLLPLEPLCLVHVAAPAGEVDEHRVRLGVIGVQLDRTSQMSLPLLCSTQQHKCDTQIVFGLRTVAEVEALDE